MRHQDDHIRSFCCIMTLLYFLLPWYYSFSCTLLFCSYFIPSVPLCSISSRNPWEWYYFVFLQYWLLPLDKFMCLLQHAVIPSTEVLLPTKYFIFSLLLHIISHTTIPLLIFPSFCCILYPLCSIVSLRFFYFFFVNRTA